MLRFRGQRHLPLMLALALLNLLFLSTACHRHRARARAPLPPPAPGAPILQGEEGVASWYGVPYNGRPTANGEIYNMYAMTAAHRTLPFGTRVRVHDLEDSRSVEVRINDRGPFVEGRIIDLSYAAAQALGMPGTARVRLEILNPEIAFGPHAIPGVYAVQVGAFRDPTNATRLKALIASRYGPVIIQGYDRGDGLFYRVRVGRLGSQAGAQSLADQLREASLATATYVVRLN